MDAILQYASSPSPPSSPSTSGGNPTGTTGASAPSMSLPVVANEDENRRLRVAERLAGQRRAFAHQSTREEDAFKFRGYASKRRRRHATPPIVASGELDTRGSSNDLPLFERSDEIPSISTTDSRHKTVAPLRKRDRQRFIGHDKAVNELQWHPQYSDLFLSASMDATVRVWKCSAEEREVSA